MRLALLAMAAVTACLTSAFAQDDEALDILSNHNGFKPKLTFTDTYTEKIVSYRDEGELFREVAANPQKISAKITANLAEFDFSEVAEDMEVGLEVGNFSFGGTLGEDHSRKRDENGEPVAAFDPGKKKAVYYYYVEVERPNGDVVSRKVGSITFAWNTSTKLLTITLAVSNASESEAGEIVASSFVGAAGSDGEKSASLKIDNEAVPVSVTFGSASGSRISYAKGVTKTSVRKFGSGDDAEYFSYESVTVQGSADFQAPTLVVSAPSSDTDADGFVEITGSLSDLGFGTITGELPGVEAFVQIGDGEFTFEFLDLTEPDAQTGRRTFSLDLALEGASNVVQVIAFDESGNTTVFSKTITTTFDF